MAMVGRYKITQPIRTRSVDEAKRVLNHFAVRVIDGQTGQVAREFRATDPDEVRAGLQAVDEMMDWLKNAAP